LRSFQARDSATAVLAVQPLNTKALFRRGVAWLELGEYDNAKVDLQQALVCRSNINMARNCNEVYVFVYSHAN
jgi:hypothetical protein